MTVLKMYPMDCKEFMIANDVSKMTSDLLERKYNERKPVDDFINGT